MGRAKNKKPAASHPNDALWREVIAETRMLADTLRDGGLAAVEQKFRVTRLPAATASTPPIHPVPPPEAGVRESSDRLQAKLAAFTYHREQAEAKCAEVNPKIQRIGAVGMAEPGRQVVGEVVTWKYYPESDSTTYWRAAIQVPAGVGVLQYTLAHREEPEEYSPRWFIPFADCEPPVQAELVSQIDKLYKQLERELDTPPVG